MNMYNNKKNIYLKGFTLIETMVAITILVTSIVGPLVIAYQGVSIGIDSRDRLVASYLAQDAIEYVRYHIVTKSNSGATSTGVMVGLEDCDANNSKVCSIDTKSDNVALCNNSGSFVCDDLLWNSDNHYYGYSGSGNWESTHFNREVRVYWDSTDGPGTDDTSGLGGGTEYRIEAKVYWGKNKEKDLTVVGDMIDWRTIFN